MAVSLFVDLFSADSYHGVVSARCGEKGKWNVTEAPVCKRVTCSTPERLLNGWYQISDNNGNGNEIYGEPTFGHDVQFACNAGYRLVGEAVRKCLPDGSWSGSQPQCQCE